MDAGGIRHNSDLGNFIISQSDEGSSICVSSAVGVIDPTRSVFLVASQLEMGNKPWSLTVLCAGQSGQFVRRLIFKLGIRPNQLIILDEIDHFETALLDQRAEIPRSVFIVDNVWALQGHENLFGRMNRWLEIRERYKLTAKHFSNFLIIGFDQSMTKGNQSIPRLFRRFNLYVRMVKISNLTRKSDEAVCQLEVFSFAKRSMASFLISIRSGAHVDWRPLLLLLNSCDQHQSEAIGATKTDPSPQA